MITAKFKAAAKDHNLRRVHIMMKDSLITDPSFRTFREMEQAAIDMEGLYVPHDGTVFLTDEATWTKDYMNGLLVAVVDNFSRERVKHLMKVVQKLHPIQEGWKVVREQTVASSRGRETRQERYSTPVVHTILPRVLKGAAAGAALLGMVGILNAPMGIFVGFLMGAIIGGGLAYATQMKGRRLR